MNNEETKSIKDQIFKKINERKIAPRSRAYFLFLSGVFILVLILVSGALFFVSSFVVSMIRESGGIYLTNFGFRGLKVLFVSLPWLLIFAAVTLFIMLQYSARRFRFAYRKPALITLFGLALLTLLGSTLFAASKIHRRALELTERGSLPVLGPVYRYYGIRPRHNFLIGTFNSQDNNELTVITRDGRLRVVRISSSTRLEPGLNPSVGDALFILGEEKGESFSALGLRLLREDEVFIPPHIRSRLPPMPR